MSRILRVAMSETKNVFEDMPERVQDLPRLSGRLEEVRRVNVEHHVALIAAAASQGVQIFCCGELFTGPYFAASFDPVWLDLAEDAADGPTISTLRTVARQHDMILVAPIFELCPATNKRFNTAVVIDEKGEVLGKYRKTHIPEGANEQGSFHEKSYYEASDGKLGEWPADLSQNPFFPVFETSRVKLGLAICYDRHFGGAIRSLAHNGVELVLCPAVTFGAKSRRLWELEFPVDAARERIFIGGSNRKGAEAPWGQEFFGASYFAGPDGVLPSLAAGAGWIAADLDLDSLRGRDPSGWTLGADARPEIYD